MPTTISDAFKQSIRKKVKTTDYYFKNALYIAENLFTNKPKIHNLDSINVLNKPVSVWDTNESALYLLLKGYSISKYFMFWDKQWDLENEFSEYQKIHQEGWKLHITVPNVEEYLFVLQYVLPELQNLKITHKIIRPDKLEEFNDRNKHPIQCGKDITLYMEDIFQLSNLPSFIKEYLLIENELKIVTDKYLGGKVYARYSGFSHDYVIHPKTNEMIYVPREEGYYKPSWIPEPPNLDEILKQSV